MRPAILALEGPDGAGKTTQAAAVARSLRENGISAAEWHHPKPPDTLGWYQRALWYAFARAEFLAAPPSAEVVVVDRWTWSTEAASHAYPARAGTALRWLATSEVYADHDLRVRPVLLTAPVGVLTHRLERRGEHVPADLAEHVEAYESIARRGRWPAVSTEGAPADTTARLVTIARGWL